MTYTDLDTPAISAQFGMGAASTINIWGDGEANVVLSPKA